MVGVSRLTLYGLASSTVTALAVINAFRQRGNFYAATVYLAKSSGSIMILWNQAIYQTVLIGKVMQAIFFGQLRMIELERLQERGWFAATETLLALTIFKEDFESTFVALCVGLLFLKVFHWLASDRVEMMEQSPNISRAFHARMISLLGLLWLVDSALLLYSIESILTEGPTVMIMFASEYLILLAMVWSTTMRYGINCIDLRRDPLNPWEHKSIYLFYVDLCADFFKLATYSLFFFLILTFYGLPLNILRDVYITLRSFLGKLRDLRRYRLATSNMDALYPDATKEEVERGDATCIICREEMEWKDRAEGGAAGGDARPATEMNETPKKLTCGHIFHFHCLRSWLERQQSCPTCRRPVLESDQARANAAAPPPPAAAAPAAPPAPGQAPAAAARPAAGARRGGGGAGAQEGPVHQARINLARNLGRQAYGVLFPGEEFPQEALEQPRPQPTPTTPSPGPAPTAAERANGTAPRPAAAHPHATVRYQSFQNAQPDRGEDKRYPQFSAAATAPAGLSMGAVPRDNSNPLARFSLKSFPLPQGGEAALYAPGPPVAGPSTTAYASRDSFANVAYGAYPRGLQRQSSAGAASLGVARDAEALLRQAASPGAGASATTSAGAGASATAGPSRGEARKASAEAEEEMNARRRRHRERMAEDKARWAKNDALSARFEADRVKFEQEMKDENDKALKELAELEQEEEDGETKIEDEEKKDDVEGAEQAANPREAARLAAEKRAAAAAGRGMLSASSSNGTTALDVGSSTSKVESALEDGVETTSDSSAQPGSASSTAPSQPTPTHTPAALPRLIPLFPAGADVSSLSAEFPHLLSSLPASLPLNPYSTHRAQSLPSQSFLPSLIGSSTTPLKRGASSPADELEEADRLTRKMLEDRLRLVRSFQDRLEGLGREMSAALEQPEASAVPSARVDKGKGREE